MFYVKGFTIIQENDCLKEEIQDEPIVWNFLIMNLEGQNFKL